MSPDLEGDDRADAPPRSGTPRAASAMVESDSWRMALDLALHDVIAAGDPAPDVVLLFASPAYSESFPDLVRETRERTGAGILLGCAASGFLANGVELEHHPGLALIALWLPGAILHPIRLHQEHVGLLREPERWIAATGTPPDRINAWLLFAEPYRIDVQAVIQGVEQIHPGAAIVGGLSSGNIQERQTAIFFDDQVYDEGGVALAIGGPYQILPFVSQGCGPIGETWTITDTDRNALLTISNRPVLDVLSDTLAPLPEPRRQQAMSRLVVGFAADEYRDEFHRGDFVVRGVIGIDQQRGAIIVGGMPRVGQTIQFHLRDARAADVDLHQTLTDARAATRDCALVAGILCTCNGRGTRLFNTPSHDAGAVQAAFGDVPVAGLFCAGEIGPLGTRAVLHGFTATLGLLVHTPPD